jgi:hypothetical protein
VIYRRRLPAEGSLFTLRKENSQMDKAYKRVQSYFNENGISGVPHDRAPILGPVTPINCKHPCPYGNGKTFCWPCYQKIMNEYSDVKAKNEAQAALAM